MSRFAFLALGAALAIAPAQTTVPPSPRPTTPTTGPNTTGTPGMGATVPGQTDQERPGTPHARQKTATPPRGDHETGTPVAGSAVSGPATVKGNNRAGAIESGPSLPAGAAATAPQTTGHIPMTTARPARAASTATTHSGSTPIAADQSNVRTVRGTGRRDNGAADPAMPDTAAGWLGMLFSGSLLSGAGLALRRRTA